MKVVNVSLESTAPYSSSHQHEEPKREKETADAYEQRTWRHKCNCDPDGTIVIPAMAFKQALDAVARRLGDQIPGRGKNTYTKHFAAGVICEHDVRIGVTRDEVPSVRLSCNSDGKRGSGKRVFRIFPQVAQWHGVATFAVLDETVTKEVFERHMQEAGRFIGVGRFRPENGGLNGRFRATKFEWAEI